MLFREKFLSLIEQRKVRVAFRKWIRPSVRKSGTLLTPVGQLKIESIEQITYESITDQDILNAGYTDRGELDIEFSLRDTGDIYKIHFALEGADPRIELRENTDISQEEMISILDKLNRYDTRGSIKNWTSKVLNAVNEQPGKYAAEYARQLGYEKSWFKLNIRKLKNMGLTISLVDGYKISPRGKVVLARIKKERSHDGDQ